MSKDNLGDRIKTYEYVTRQYLLRRTPVIIRIDGKAFHTYTKGFERPFDRVLTQTMQDTMKYLCENVEGCVIGYTQSDEITLVLCDYKKLNTQAWFNANVQKMCSVAASMATMAFNYSFEKNVKANVTEMCKQGNLNSSYIRENVLKRAVFDARVFNVPKEEVNNCLLWRQQDATRNSIQSVAHAYFSDKQIKNKNTNMLQEMLWQEKGINWNNYPTHYKRGSCCVKEQYEVDGANGKTLRTHWVVDTEIPIFSKDTTYVNSRIIFPNTNDSKRD